MADLTASPNPIIDEARFIELLERVLLAVYILETVRNEQGEITDFIFTYVNQTGAQQLNMSREQMVGQRLCELLPINRTGGFFDKYKQAVESGQAFEEQYYIPEGYRSAGWWYHQVVPMRDGVAIGRRDITAAKEAEEAQIQQAALQAALEKETDLSRFKSEMMRRISHEFRTPLTRIGLAGDMLERYFEQMSREQVSERIRSIREGIAQLEAMLGALSLAVTGLEITREDEMLETLDLRQFCLDLVERYWDKHLKNQSLIVDAPAPTMMTTNRRLLELVLVNLISNAIKFSPLGSDIRVTITQSEDRVKITICDSGIGILPDDLPHVFKPFYRGRNFDEIPGIGVGLTIVQNALIQLGGTIHIESEPERGTTVEVILFQ
ncbi:MAG: hypothetical protein CUN53_12435 [Phototrophicales bacterium]|nr:MAG: hypothetical protein CUN53_12435 [Phototrophicales bacterium]